VDVSTLSQGTLDTVYLAARIGLVRLVTGDRRPPLVLDDPFVTLDDARAERALELLHDISTDFQVIYLTTSDRYDKTADKVALLEPATALTPDGVLDEPEPAAEDAAPAEPAASAAASAASDSGDASEPSAEVVGERA
jgi:ABC-type Mn2+/Zn2+ transport system ATPase subunit